jgi:hypothetical protein
MPTLFNIQLWLKHAEEARALSTVIADPQTRRQMLGIAVGFEHIADLASKLRATSDMSSRSGRQTPNKIRLGCMN